MKKIIICLSVLIFIFLIKSYNNDVIIPDDALRFRVIANSDSNFDQEIKLKVKEKLESEIASDLENVNNTDIAKKILKSRLPEFNDVVSSTLKVNNVDYDFDINFGYNYFPEKVYKGVTYKEGNYESLVVTLGEGKGSNFWCVMFPPLCLIEAEEDYNSNNTEYRFFVKDLIDNFFK